MWGFWQGFAGQKVKVPAIPRGWGAWLQMTGDSMIPPHFKVSLVFQDVMQADLCHSEQRFSSEGAETISRLLVSR